MSSGIGDETASVSHQSDKAICRDCDRSWSGSAVDDVAAAHSSRYDHRVEVIHRTIYDGPEDSDG